MSVSPLITATPAVPPYVVRAEATNALLATAPCRLVYLRVSASTAGSLTLFDNTNPNLTSVIGTASFAAGTTVVPIETGGKHLKNGLFATFTTLVGVVDAGLVRN